MKHLKAKLMTSIVMLLIAAIAMSTASYAWFTISTAPEISNIKTKVGANGNLEIALSSAEAFGTDPSASAAGDAGKNVAWGNLVDLSAFTFSELKPCSFSAGTISVPTFGLDGRIAKVEALTPTWTPLVTTASDTVDFDDGGLYEYKDTAGKIWAYRIDFFMRSNVAGTVSLSEAADRGDGVTTTGGAGWGAGSTITANSNISIAFYQGTTELLTLDAEDTADGKLEGEVIELEANTTEKISMYIFIDGATLKNEDLLTEDLDVSINIQFKHSATLDPLDVEGTGHDKPASGS